MNYKVSIVITAYNVGKYIKECVQSAIGQTFPCEVIVVADCPTDNTLQELEQFGKRIRVIPNKINVGAGYSRQIGIAAATGEYVMLLDGDDYIGDIHFVDELYKRAQETKADVVSGGIKILNEDGTWNATSYGNCTTEGRDKVAKFWGERIVFMNNKLIRRSLYDKVPYCGRRYIEDTPTIIPILLFANKVVYVDNIGYTYRMREDSLTHTTNPLKDVIYKGLCWIELVEFFNAVDKGMFDVLNFRGYLGNIIATLNKMHITPEAVAPYKADWDELVMRLWNVMEVTGVNLLDAPKGTKSEINKE